MLFFPERETIWPQYGMTWLGAVHDPWVTLVCNTTTAPYRFSVQFFSQGTFSRNTYLWNDVTWLWTPWSMILYRVTLTAFKCCWLVVFAESVVKIRVGVHDVAWRIAQLAAPPLRCEGGGAYRNFLCRITCCNHYLAHKNLSGFLESLQIANG